MKAQADPTLFQFSEITVSYHPKFKVADRPKVDQSRLAYEIFLGNWNPGKLHYQEQCYMMLLNRANKVIGIAEISTGGVAGTCVDPKIIFGIALKANASYLILAHSHPSGNLKPSDSDLRITKQCVEAGKLLDLLVIDHLIVTANGYYSFGDEGLI